MGVRANLISLSIRASEDNSAPLNRLLRYIAFLEVLGPPLPREGACTSRRKKRIEEGLSGQEILEIGCVERLGT
jgi:hypothetical protein